VLLIRKVTEDIDDMFFDSKCVLLHSLYTFYTHCYFSIIIHMKRFFFKAVLSVPFSREIARIVDLS
jgi:hypothetical protein